MVTKREFSLTQKKNLLFFLLTNLVTPHLHAQQKEIKFEHIIVEQGLSQNFVECIYQDSEGFMWFGLHDGLNRYDGYTLKVYSARRNRYNGHLRQQQCLHTGAHFVFDKSTEFEAIPEVLANYSQTPFVAA